METVGIYNEEGKKENDTYEVVRRSTGTKNVIEIQNLKTGQKRLIYKDRIFSLEKRSTEVEKNKDDKKKAKKKKKPLVKFDLKDLDGKGVLFKSKKKNSMDTGAQKINIESFCIVSEDATKWKHFNLYNNSLGKKGKPPEFGENDNVKVELSGDLERVEKYLEKKGYNKL